MDDILIDILFCVLFLLVPFMVFLLLPYAGIFLRRFSIPSFFTIVYLATVYIGILALYFHWDLDRVSAGAVDRKIILEMFMYSSGALMIIICGFIYAKQVIGLRNYDVRHRELVRANNAQCIFMFCVFLLCGLVLVAYIRKVDAIALFTALQGDFFEAAVARSAMGTTFAGKYWRYELFFRTLLDYCAFFFFADWLIKRHRISIFLFAGCLLVAVFSAVLAIEKGPVSKLLIMLYITFVIYKGGNYWQAVGKYAVVMIICVQSIIFVYFVGYTNIWKVLMDLSSRLFTGQITPAYFYLDLFPRRIDYLWGASFPNPGGILPFQSFPLAQTVADFMAPEILEQGILGTAPTVFWGEIYANFGPVAIVLSSFLVGVLLFTVSHILGRLPLSPPVIAASVSLALHYRTLTATGISSYFLDTTLLAITGVTFISLLLDGKKRLMQRSVEAVKTSHVEVHGE